MTLRFDYYSPACFDQDMASLVLVYWLYDRSGGTGRAPDYWPRHPGGDRLVGYAGGITPETVKRVISAIDSEGPYWIDMESGVRTNDQFDVGLCKRVCEAIYG